MPSKVSLLDAARVLLDDIDGLLPLERVGQINPIAIKNLRDAVKAERRAGK